MTEGVSREQRIEAVLFAVTAVLVAWVVPGHRIGLGVSLAGLAYACLILRWRTEEPPGRLASVTAGSVLLSSAVLRDAIWVVGPSVIAGGLLLASAVIPLRRMRDLFVVAVIPLRFVRGWRTAAATVMRPVPPDAAKRLAPVVRGLAIGVPLLVLFSALFVSADRAFARFAEEALLFDVDLALLPQRVALGSAAFIMAGALKWASVEREPGWSWRLSPFEGTVERSHRSRASLEWVLPLVMLVALFGAFVAVQFAVLFGGRTHVLDTAGLTYAEYARSGFFQLLVVGALVLFVMGATRRWVTPDGRRQHLILEVLLGALAALSIVVLVSALYRLHLYIDAFGLTRARFGARLVMVWVAVLLVGAVARGFIRPGPWLVRGAVLAAAAVMAIGVVQDPDAAIARAGVERWEATGRIDVAYLSGLSADAVPELLRLPDPLRSCVLRGHFTLDREPWSAWNMARARARAELLTGRLDRITSPRCPEGG